MHTIRLENAEWNFDEGALIGSPGGFGEVFRGSGGNGPVAVKRLRLSAAEAAFRELKIGEALAGRGFKHVVPILDFGLDPESDRYFIVMPICESSLAHGIAADAPFDVPELCQITLDILNGLLEVVDMVHRDLKPANVLLLDGRWRLADFGLAKFVEESTSLQTVRDCLTPAYAAPEQWRGEKVSHQADVYSLGCIIYELASGVLPFGGPHEEVREGHLQKAPPPLLCSDARLSALVSQMLRKPPEVRPSLQRCHAAIEEIKSGKAPAPSRKHLFEAIAHIETATARAEAEKKAADARAKARHELTVEAASNLRLIKEKLFGEISSLTKEFHRAEDTISLGHGKLEFGRIESRRGSIDGSPNCSRSSWDVCAFSLVGVEQAPRESLYGKQHVGGVVGQPRIIDVQQKYTWTSTLVFASLPDDPAYRWREVSFYGFSAGDQPFALSPTDDSFDVAVSPVLGSVHLAFGPKAIDAEDETDFIERWLLLLSKAIVGKLGKPHSLPIDDNYFRSEA